MSGKPLPSPMSIGILLNLYRQFGSTRRVAAIIREPETDQRGYYVSYRTVAKWIRQTGELRGRGGANHEYGRWTREEGERTRNST